MTNYEKIKAVGVEEMARFLSDIVNNCAGSGICPKSCPLHDTETCTKRGIIEWLKSEVNENANE